MCITSIQCSMFNIDLEDNGTKDITPETSSQVFPKKPKGVNNKPACKRKLSLYEEVYLSDEQLLPSSIAPTYDDGDYSASDKE